MKATTAAVQCIDVNIVVSFYFSAFRRSYGILTRRTVLKICEQLTFEKKTHAKEVLCIRKQNWI